MILITGTSGFLGKNLLEILDPSNVLTPTSKELNLLDINSVEEYFKTHKIDKILHMAAICGGIGLNKKRPADLTHQNLKMTINLFDMIRKHNIEWFYGLGSVCSYPMYCQVPFKEENLWNGKPELTNSGYGEAKRMMITEFQTHKEQFGLKGAMLIPVNLFGPQDHFDLKNSHVIPALINKFVNAVKNNIDTVECWGTGKVSREFLYCKDLAKAIDKAIKTSLDVYDPINIGTGKEITIHDLANLIGELTDFNGKIQFTGDVSDGQPRRCLDVSKAKEHLDFIAETSLRDGLKKTIEWYKAQF